MKEREVLKHLLSFLLNIAIIILYTILQDVFSFDVVVLTICVLEGYILTNGLVGEIHITWDYFLMLIVISIFYVYSGKIIIIELYSAILKLSCGAFISSANKLYLTETELKAKKALAHTNTKRLSSYDLAIREHKIK